MIVSEGSSSELLSSCESIAGRLTRDDIVILGFGSHDRDLHKFHSNLCISINMLYRASVYIVPVNHNPCFDEYQLCNSMKIWTRHFDRCNFVDLKRSFFYGKLYHTHSHYIKDICNKINIYIDFLEYKKQFLTFKNISKIRINNSESKQVRNKHNCSLISNEAPKRGTIPYYFRFMKRPQFQNLMASPKHNVGNQTKLICEPNATDSKFFRPAH